MPRPTTVDIQGNFKSTYFHGRLAAEEMRKLYEIAAAFETTPALAMGIILRRVRVQPPIITLGESNDK